MDLVDSLEEMFQWQAPFCYTSLNDVVSFEVVIPTLDAMLVDIELPEINMESKMTVAAALEPIPLSPSNYSITTTPVVDFAIEEASAPKLISVHKGTRAFEILAPTTSPLSCSAPKTPPVLVKPKRARGSGPTKPVVTKPAKKDSASFRRDAAKSKETTRVPTKAEHIIRERQRRDDMAAKYATLESLLPPACKREKATVVEDAISFLEALEQKKTQLQKKSANLKLKASCNQSPWGKSLLGPLPQSLGTVVDNPSPPLSAPSNSTIVHVDPVYITSDQVAIGPRGSAISAINVHLGEEEIVVEIVWRRSRPNFQSALLRAVELLGFDVTKCCILRVENGYVQCVITCTKIQGLSQRTSEIQSSSTMISRALRDMLTLTD